MGTAPPLTDRKVSVAVIPADEQARRTCSSSFNLFSPVKNHMGKDKKRDFMAEVTTALAEVFALYKVTWPNKAEEKAFKEDLLLVVTDLIKGSFKNGIRIGRTRAEHGEVYDKGGAH